MIRAITSAAMLLMLQGSAIAQEAGTAHDLYNRCVKNEPLCGAYLMGVASVLTLMGKTYQDRQLEPDFVAPLNVFAICSKGAPATGHVLRNIFVAWIETNPARKAEGMAAGAITAMKDAWPCPERSN